MSELTIKHATELVIKKFEYIINSQEDLPGGYFAVLKLRKVIPELEHFAGACGWCEFFFRQHWLKTRSHKMEPFQICETCPLALANKPCPKDKSWYQLWYCKRKKEYAQKILDCARSYLEFLEEMEE